MSSTPSPSARGPIRLKIVLMGFILSVLFPLLFLCAFELALRLGGFGQPTSFWIEDSSTPEEYWGINHNFTFQFFPKTLARGIIPHRVTTEVPKDTFRIVIFGESAANGDPDAAYGMGRFLEVLLEERYPGLDVEIVCTAITAINSHVIRQIAKDTARLESDLWVIYMGNNEMIGPFGAGSVFGSYQLPLPLIRANLALKRTRTGQLLTSIIEKASWGDEAPDKWEGINMFAQNILHPTHSAREKVYYNFARNLEEILSIADSSSIPVVLSTVASNLVNCAPFASMNHPSLSNGDKADWSDHYNYGLELIEKGDYRRALSSFEKASLIDNSYAELNYHIARCYDAEGDFIEAQTNYIKARDNDALSVRADSQINNIIRSHGYSDDYPLIHFMDTEMVLREALPENISREDLFYEHVHFTLKGNYAISRAFADEFHSLLSVSFSHLDNGEWPTYHQCQQLLSVTLWDKHRLWSDMQEQLMAPPFNQRFGNEVAVELCGKKATFYKNRLRPDIDHRIYKEGLNRDSNDYFIRYRYGRYLLLNGFENEAIDMFRWIVEHFPSFEGGYQELGVALFLNGQIDEAEETFRQVLELNPYYQKAHKALELIEQSKVN